MVSFARFTSTSIWLLALCVIALVWSADLSQRSGGWLDPLASQPGDENNFTASPADAFDLMDDFALLTTAGLICWPPVVLALNLPLPAEWAWSSTPPVRPPILSTSL